jgi:hypothetical protein
VQNPTAAVLVLTRRGGKRGLVTAYTVAMAAGIGSVGLAARAALECRKDCDFLAAREIVRAHAELACYEHVLLVEQLLPAMPTRGDGSGGGGGGGGSNFVAAVLQAWATLDVGAQAAAVASSDRTDV